MGVFVFGVLLIALLDGIRRGIVAVAGKTVKRFAKTIRAKAWPTS